MRRGYSPDVPSCGALRSLPVVAISGLLPRPAPRRRWLVVLRLLERPHLHVVEDACDHDGEHGEHAQRAREPAPPHREERSDLRLPREPVELGVSMRQHVHDVRAADALRTVYGRLGESPLVQVLQPVVRLDDHVLLRAEGEGLRRAGLDTRRLESHRDPIGTERALVDLRVLLAETRDVEGAAGDAIAAADAVLLVEIDDAIRILHDGARGGARLEAAGICAVHALILEDEPL